MNSSRQLYQRFIGQGMTKDAAFFAVLDHFVSLWLHDRDRYDERIRTLEVLLAALEKGQHPE